MKRVHGHGGVDDLRQSVWFYSAFDSDGLSLQSRLTAIGRVTGKAPA